MAWKATGILMADLADGAMREGWVADEPVLLIRHGTNVLAFQGRCPHEGGTLADGELQPGRVVCPLHGATFEVPSGTIVADPDGVTPPSGDVPSLRVYPARVVGGSVEVDLG